MLGDWQIGKWASGEYCLESLVLEMFILGSLERNGAFSWRKHFWWLGPLITRQVEWKIYLMFGCKGWTSLTSLIFQVGISEERIDWGDRYLTWEFPYDLFFCWRNLICQMFFIMIWWLFTITLHLCGKCQSSGQI